MSAFKDEKTLQISKEEREVSDSDDEELEVLPTNERHGPGGKTLIFNHTDKAGLSRDTEIWDGESRALYVDIS